MTTLLIPPVPVATVPDEPRGLPRRPYLPPRAEPLGEWTALTLVTSLPVGPGGMVFGGPPQG